MKSKLLVLSAAIGLMAMTAGVTITAQRDTGLTPTFNKDVAPIIFNRCVSCHRPNQIAPMTLMSYKEARPWARAIKTKVSTGQMPPWYADGRYGQFVNDRRLTHEQIKTIVEWVDAGAPEGNTPLTAAVPDFRDGWTHPSGRPPDMIIEMAEAFTVPAEGELPGFIVYQDLPRELKDKDHFLEAIQILPSALPVVHHMRFDIAPLPPGTKIGPGEAWPGGPPIAGALVDAKTGKRAVVEVREDDDDGGDELRFCCYVPGGTFQQFPPGAGKRINPKGVVGWQMHYTTAGRPMADRPRAGLWFQKEMTREIVFSGANEARHHIILGKELVDDAFTPVKGTARNAFPAIPVIPPYAKDWAITAIRGIQDDTTVYTMWPHMHLRGKEMTILVTYPDGREEVLMSAPKYDFNWQLFYQPKEPIRIPAGSTVKTIGSMDNSPANRWNPAPQKEVYWSEQSWDEMFIGVFEISVDKKELPKTPRQPTAGAQ